MSNKRFTDNKLKQCKHFDEISEFCYIHKMKIPEGFCIGDSSVCGNYE